MSSALSISQIKLIHETFDEIIEKSRIKESLKHIQHGTTTVFEHSLSVTYYCLKIANTFKWKIDEKSMIRGALLHDYFLYDWHDKKNRLKLHGYFHPALALKNAMEIFDLNEIEKDIIKHHMFPLTLCPPKTKEGFIIILSDKWCSLYETFKINEWKNGKYARKLWTFKEDRK